MQTIGNNVEITIRGERAIGKTTIALIIKEALAKYGIKKVDVIDSSMPKHIEEWYHPALLARLQSGEHKLDKVRGITITEVGITNNLRDGR